MPQNFVRVVEGDGWRVELLAESRVVNVDGFDQAMAAARAANPEWIEVGRIVAAREGRPRHHQWTTLRRTGTGDYVRSGLGWGGPSG